MIHSSTVRVVNSGHVSVRKPTIVHARPHAAVVSRGVRSMTGYGRGVAERDGLRAVVEIRSVNHRFLDIKIRGFSVEPALEKRIEQRLRAGCHRGSINLSIRIERHGAAAAMHLDSDVAASVYHQMVQLARTLKLDATVTLAQVCQQPGVWVSGDDSVEGAPLTACVETAVDAAVTGLLDMRTNEGDTLEVEISTRLDRLLGVVQQVETHAGTVTQAAQTRLHERIARLLDNTSIEVNEDRLAHEIAILADKLDITEELVRLRGHVKHARQVVDASRTDDSAVGRRIDFLLQEMGREINTVGSKSQSADIARLVVEAKAELEKMREQAQNIE